MPDDSTRTIAHLLHRLITPTRAMTVWAPPFVCPLHSRTPPSLWPVAAPGMVLRCSYSRCRFVGSLAELAALTRQVSIDQALALVQPGGQLFDAGLAQRLREVPEQDIKLSYALNRYIHQCRKSLQEHGMSLQAAMEGHGVRREFLTKSLCGSTRRDALPPSLAFLDVSEYAGFGWLLMPFYNGPQLTHIGMYHPTRGELRRYVIERTAGTPGIFLEREMNWPAPATVLVCGSEIDALVAGTKLENIGLQSAITAVSVSAPAALKSIPSLKEIVLLVAPKSPLGPAVALEYLQTMACRMSVLTIDEPIGKLPSAALAGVRGRTKPLWDWFVDVAVNLVDSGHPILVELPMTDLIRRQLTQALREHGSDPEAPNKASGIIGTHVERKIGRVCIVRRPEGYLQTAPTERWLSNFTIHVEHYEDSGKDKALIGTLHTNQPDEPGHPIRVPLKVMNHRGAKVANYLWQQLMNQTNCQLQMGDPDDKLDWITVIRTFDDAPYRLSVSSLGMMPTGELQYPSFVLDTKHHEFRAVDDARAIGRAALGAMINIRPEQTDLSPVAALWSSTNPLVAGMAGILAHALHQTISSIIDGHSYKPQHLIMPAVNGRVSYWTPSLSEIHRMFSGQAAIPTLSGESDLKAFSRDMTELGTLPCFCILRKWSKLVDSWLDGAHHPIMAIGGPTVVPVANRRQNCSLSKVDIVGLDVTEVAPPDPALAAQLALVWPELIKQILLNIKPTMSDMVSSIPAEAGSRWVESLLKLEANYLIRCLFVDKLLLPGYNTPEAFLMALGDVVGSGKMKLAKKHWTVYNSAEWLGCVEENGDIYLPTNRSIDAAEEHSPDCGFSLGLLTPALMAMGIARNRTDAQSGRKSEHWIVPKALWDFYSRRANEQQLAMLDFKEGRSTTAV